MGVKMAGKAKRICLLLNAIFFRSECVFIIIHENQYQLVVICGGTLLTEEYFQTLADAKAAFSRLYGHRGWKENIKAEWTPLYEPDNEWLTKKIAAARGM